MTAQHHPTLRPQNAGDEMLTSRRPAPSSGCLRAPCATGATSGSGPRSFKLGRHVRYWRADLILWLSEQTNRPQNHR